MFSPTDNVINNVKRHTYIVLPKTFLRHSPNSQYGRSRDCQSTGCNEDYLQTAELLHMYKSCKTKNPPMMVPLVGLAIAKAPVATVIGRAQKASRATSATLLMALNATLNITERRRSAGIR